MPGVISQGDRSAVLGAQAALGADNHVLLAVDLFRMPAHRDILRHRKEVAAGFIQKHVFVEGQLALAALAPSPRRRQQIRPAIDIALHGFVSLFFH